MTPASFLMGTIFSSIYIYDSRLNRPESVSLASLARQLVITFNTHFPFSVFVQLGSKFLKIKNASN